MGHLENKYIVCNNSECDGSKKLYNNDTCYVPDEKDKSVKFIDCHDILPHRPSIDNVAICTNCFEKDPRFKSYVKWNIILL